MVVKVNSLVCLPFLGGWTCCVVMIVGHGELPPWVHVHVQYM